MILFAALFQKGGRVHECLVLENPSAPDNPANGDFHIHDRILKLVTHWLVSNLSIEKAPNNIALRGNFLGLQLLKNIFRSDFPGDANYSAAPLVNSAKAKKIHFLG